MVHRLLTQLVALALAYHSHLTTKSFIVAIVWPEEANQGERCNVFLNLVNDLQ